MLALSAFTMHVAEPQQSHALLLQVAEDSIQSMNHAPCCQQSPEGRLRSVQWDGQRSSNCMLSRMQQSSAFIIVAAAISSQGG